MRTTENKLICYTSKKSSFLKKEIHSKLISSSQSKSGCKISYNKRCKLKPISHVKKTRRRKKVLSGKPIKTQQKVSDMGSAKRQSSLKLLGKSSSCLSRRGNWKNAAGNGGVRRSDKRRKRKRKKKNIEQDEASRLKRRARYLLIKMKLEQNLIDAYSGDGWKGQSREKIKPEKELQRAEKQILICKLGIRDAIHQLDLLSSEGCIEDSVIYPDGSVFHEHIFCAKCKSREAFPDNDIILCDGTCNCGFHQKCLEPPLEKIPPADQGWLCKFCECKMEILEAINAHLGTCFAVNSNWEDIFKEATISLDDESTYLDPAEEWPSEDSEDDDYYPERSEKSNSRTGLEGKMADDASSSSGLCCTSDDATSCFERSEDYDWDGGSSQVRSKSKGNMDCDSIISIGSGDTSDCEITSYRRQRRDVDYKKLYDEMFGKDLPGNEQQSEDEDWGPHSRKRRRIESDAGATISCGVEKKLPLISCDRKALFRIPHDAVEKLRQIFAENELPSRAVKENLSKQLGIASEKVSKWFKNARYAALKIRKAGSTKQQSPNIIKRSRASARKNQSSDGIPSTPNFLSFTSGVHVPKNLRRIRRRENLMSITTPLRKHHKRAAKAVPTGKIQKVRTKILIENQYPSMSVQRNLSKEKGRPYNQASTCPSNEVYLKKQVNGLRSKFPLTFNSTGRSVSQVDEIAENGQLYFVEMERLCNLEDRLEKLKAALLSCRDEDHASKIHSREQLLIYVPIAEVKEKA